MQTKGNLTYLLPGDTGVSQEVGTVDEEALGHLDSFEDLAVTALDWLQEGDPFPPYVDELPKESTIVPTVGGV